MKGNVHARRKKCVAFFVEEGSRSKLCHSNTVLSASVKTRAVSAVEPCPIVASWSIGLRKRSID